MVVLKEIQKKGNEIEADYFSEGKGKKFHMKINYQNGKVLEHDGIDYSMAPTHVKSELIRLSNQENIPKESTVIWY